MAGSESDLHPIRRCKSGFTPAERRVRQHCDFDTTPGEGRNEIAAAALDAAGVGREEFAEMENAQVGHSARE